MHLFLYVRALACVLPLPLAAIAQGSSFAIPSTWNTTATLSSQEQQALAQNAAQDLMLPPSTPGGGTFSLANLSQFASSLAVLSQLDSVLQSRDRQNFVQQGFQDLSGQKSLSPSKILQNDQITTTDILISGLAAFYGSRAYGNDSYLRDLATSAWSLVHESYVVNNLGLQPGSVLQTNDGSNIQNNCTDDTLSLKGAVLSKTPKLSGAMPISTAESVGGYVALSAHLWNATRNTTYLSAANTSAQFMLDNLYSNALNVVMDTFDLSSCTRAAQQLNKTSNQGLFMEGLLVLSTTASNSSVNSTQWSSLLRTLVNSTVTFSEWTTPNGTDAGVLTTADSQDPKQQDHKNIFINALFEIWSQTEPSDPMAKFIEAFVAVQFNALQYLAFDSENLYSTNWTGPPPDQRDPWGEVEALPVLYAAVKMAANPSSPTTGTPAFTSASPENPTSVSNASTSSNALSGGDIAGIVVGSIAGAILLISLAFFARRYRMRLAEKHRRVLIPSFDRSAMYAPRQNPEGTAGQLPAGHIVKDRRGFGLGETYAGSPPPDDADSARPPSALPFPVEKATATTT